MNLRSPLFRAGVGITALLAILALQLSKLPGLEHIGPLSTALLLGLLWRGVMDVPHGQHGGIGFSAKRLLRLGIVLLGVRLNFDLIFHAGMKIVLLDISIIGVGLCFITWLGLRFGLDQTLASLIAVDSSICGASAVAAAAPAFGARDDEAALVIPLGSLIGTAAMLAFTIAQTVLHLSPNTYGILTGATLHEVAQVMAAASAVPGALEIGAVTKLTRVLFLIPAVWLLGTWLQWRSSRTGTQSLTRAAKPWFVLGFLAVGCANTLAFHFWPQAHAMLMGCDQEVLEVSSFLMAMAMAGMGLQVDFERLRVNGLRAGAVALVGWLVLFLVAAMELRCLNG